MKTQNAKKILGSLAVVIFAFSAVIVTSSIVDQAQAAKSIVNVKK